MEIVFNDLKLIKQIPNIILSLFLIILVNAVIFLHISSFSRMGYDEWFALVINEPRPITILGGIIVSLLTLLNYIKRLRKHIKIIYDDIKSEISITNITKKEQRIKLQDIIRIKLYTVTNYLDDEPLFYSEEINLYDKDDKVILSYKSKKLQTLVDFFYRKNNEIKIEYGNIKEKK